MGGLRESETGTPGPHYAVLDALRFVLAVWVAVGHYSVFPLFAGVDTATSFGRFVTHAWQTVVFGTPAVIVFFVISGFCIHLPFRGDKKLAVGRYYVRRYTRILIPVGGALCVYQVMGDKLRFWGQHSILWESPLWSLACEEIYYAAYPLLRALRNRIGWKVLLPAAYLGGVLTAARHPHSTTWHDFGPVGTAVILLPVWLLGCLLAEQSDAVPAVGSASRIWTWRLVIWVACWVSEMLHFKAGVPSMQTMVWFGVLAYFWVRAELGYSGHCPPNRYLVAGGAWSYSLYLLHSEGPVIFARLPIPNLGYFLNWFGAMFSSLALSYIFYLFLERPSHRLARSISVRGTSKPGPMQERAPQTGTPLASAVTELPRTPATASAE